MRQSGLLLNDTCNRDVSEACVTCPLVEIAPSLRFHFVLRLGNSHFKMATTVAEKGKDFNTEEKIWNVV